MFWMGVLSLAIAMTSGDPAPPRAAEEAPAPAESAKPRGRLPNHYGKLSVTAAQREQIYAVQAEYDGRIDELLAQIEQLRSDRNAAVEALLTPEQRQKLAELREAQAARRKARSDAQDK
jgi:Spy/CpxP family protein refolding chaperone